jgi:hypothetical protein
MINSRARRSGAPSKVSARHSAGWQRLDKGGTNLTGDAGHENAHQDVSGRR